LLGSESLVLKAWSALPSEFVERDGTGHWRRRSNTDTEIKLHIFILSILWEREREHKKDNM